MSDNGNALDLRARVDDSGWLARHGLRALVADLWAEVQRLTAELALKDQALDEIKALAEGWRARASDIRQGSDSMKTLRAALRESCADDIQRVLTRLDTQGETK